MSFVYWDRKERGLYTIGLFVKSKTQGLGINDDDDDDDGFEHTIVWRQLFDANRASSFSTAADL